MKTKMCIHLFPGESGTPLSGVKVEQTGRDRFRVTYGLQVKEKLNYEQAAAEFGACVFHALACDGRLDNRGRNER